MIDLARGKKRAMCTLPMPSQMVPGEDPNRQVVRIPGTLRQGLQFRACWWAMSFAQGSPTLRTRQVVDLQQASWSLAKGAENSRNIEASSSGS